jgi:hypothetical protein
VHPADPGTHHASRLRCARALPAHAWRQAGRQRIGGRDAERLARAGELHRELGGPKPNGRDRG